MKPGNKFFCLLLLAVSLAGCEKPTVVEPADRPYRREVEERVGTRRAGATRTPRSARQQTAGRPVRTQAEATPRPTATPDPDRPPAEVVVKPENFTYKENGEPDDGGWKLRGSGVAVVSPIVIPTTMTQVILEAKGDVAREIWPEVLVHMDVVTSGVANQPFKPDYVTSSGYVQIPKSIRPPLAPGEYTLTFRYLNNQEFPETSEDRNVTVRQIIFREDDPIAEEEERQQREAEAEQKRRDLEARLDRDAAPVITPSQPESSMGVAPRPSRARR